MLLLGTLNSRVKKALEGITEHRIIRQYNTKLILKCYGQYRGQYVTNYNWDMFL